MAQFYQQMPSPEPGHINRERITIPDLLPPIDNKTAAAAVKEAEATASPEHKTMEEAKETPQEQELLLDKPDVSESE